MPKNQLRSKLRELRNQLTAEQQSEYSSAIRESLFQTEVYRNCNRLFTFLSFQTEVETGHIIAKSMELGKKIYLPRVEGDLMEFYRVNSLEGLIPSKFGVLEPPASEQMKYISQNSHPYGLKNENLMLLPGLAFDLKGNRIGYGADYYDRYLADHVPLDFCKVALAYDFQVLDEIPTEEYDIAADLIITPTRIIQCIR